MEFSRVNVHDGENFLLAFHMLNGYTEILISLGCNFRYLFFKRLSCVTDMNCLTWFSYFVAREMLEIK